jgi:glycosyltransferase involved in cell wall biosynthesis/ubiquinone/menaquinone biosynthesis C-methylase UbiE
MKSLAASSTVAETRRYCYYVPTKGTVGRVEVTGLEKLSERHRFKLPPLDDADQASSEPLSVKSAVDGLIIELIGGVVGFRPLKLTRQWLRAGRPVFFYFPREEVIEVVDIPRWWSFFKLRIAHKLHWRSADDLPKRQLTQANFPFREKAVPVLLRSVEERGANPRVKGLGTYLRTDYWVKLRAGGSYGHTCYVARELAKRTEDFVCLMASHYKLIDDFGIRQLVIAPDDPSTSEQSRLLASLFYRERLYTLLDYLRPSYIYERLVPGNFAGAMLSKELGIPYIVEYNGSEISLARSFQRESITNEDLFVQAESVVFRQAAAITVVSEIVKEQVVKAGIDPNKILVNPNGADLEDYRPPTPDEKRQLRAKMGWTDAEVVIGFIGTFGGWHGIEVLAEALPRLCALSESIRFLLIGSGNLHDLITKAIRAHGLSGRIALTGQIPQEEARILMRASDIFVSPHHRNMIDSKFFGSPTKLFEYMATGGAIVASDLEQIGQVLSPALRPRDLENPNLQVKEELAVLCKPGDVDEFVAAVSALSRRGEVRSTLGKNARRAAVGQYSWSEHVDKILDFVARCSESIEPVMEAERTLALDLYKREAQQQWDTDPCGAQYVAEREDRLAFFKGVEEYRYGHYGPWMPDLMEFDRHAGESVLEIGAGIGTDLAQFAKNGAIVTDLELAKGHMALARENFEVRGLKGKFVCGDAENMPFGDASFDVVYGNGVIHHIPQTGQVVSEIFRVLKPGGKAIIMVYRENSLQYWRIFFETGLAQRMLESWSMGEIMSRTVELSTSGARPLVKVYTSRQLRDLFKSFSDVNIYRRQMVASEVPKWLRFVPLTQLEKLIGWNLIVKAVKPRA